MKKVFNWSEVHLSEVAFYKIDTLTHYITSIYDDNADLNCVFQSALLTQLLLRFQINFGFIVLGLKRHLTKEKKRQKLCKYEAKNFCETYYFLPSEAWLAYVI